VYEPFANGANQKNVEGKLADKVRNIKSMLRRLENEPSTSTGLKV